MATYNVHGGHSLSCRGAAKYLDEVNEDRIVKNKVIQYLRSAGHTVYDCTDDYGTTVNGNLAAIVQKCNAHNVDLDISIHLNAGGGTGCEVWNYDSRTKVVSDRICANISSALGIRNRGTKYEPELYVLRNSNALALLIECCFVDNMTDKNAWNAEKCAKAIAEGILNKSISTSSSSNSGTASKPSTSNLYRIRKSWSDAKSQVGAYASLDNAKKSCPSGYNVYDWNGKMVYSNSPSSSTTASSLYRVRLTWSDVKSQKGAFASLDNAKKVCNQNPGYSVFDSSGKTVYTNKSTSSNTPATPSTPVEKPKEDTKPDTPKYNDISPLKGLSNEQFLEYVGQRAKEDMKKTGVLASVTIAQSILESAWGQSELSLKANNLFGMKSSLSGNTWSSEWDGKIYSKYSDEEYNGVVTSVKSDFRMYSTVDASIKDHSDYLCGAKKGSELRYKGLKGETNYKTAIQIIKDGGYATDSGYVDKICVIIEKYELDKFDKNEEIKDDEDIIVLPGGVDISEDKDNKSDNVSGKLDSIVTLLQAILKVITNGFDLIKNLFGSKK